MRGRETVTCQETERRMPTLRWAFLSTRKRTARSRQIPKRPASRFHNCSRFASLIGTNSQEESDWSQECRRPGDLKHRNKHWMLSLLLRMVSNRVHQRLRQHGEGTRTTNRCTASASFSGYITWFATVKRRRT